MACIHPENGENRQQTKVPQKPELVSHSTFSNLFSFCSFDLIFAAIFLFEAVLCSSALKFLPSNHVHVSCALRCTSHSCLVNLLSCLFYFLVSLRRRVFQIEMWTLFVQYKADADNGTICKL